MAKQESSFEKDLEQLEQIVAALEEGGLPLDTSLKRFEEGVKLVRRCEKALGAAEKRIEVLTKNAEGELETQPFGEEDLEESPSPHPSPGGRGSEAPSPHPSPSREGERTREPIPSPQPSPEGRESAERFDDADDRIPEEPDEAEDEDELLF